MNKPVSTQLAFYYSQTAEKAIELGRAHGWHFKVVGHAPAPTKPFYLGKWWYEPVTTTPKGMDRLYALQKAGIKWSGMMIGHELYFSEVEEPKPAAPPRILKNNDILPAVGVIAGVAAMGLIGALSIIGRLILIDPALVIVLQDDTWLEIVTWVE